MSRRDPPAEFFAYLAPGVAPLSMRESEMIRLQAADLLGCSGDELRPQFTELSGLDELQAEFAWIPEHEHSRSPYLALIALLRNGAHQSGNCCCMLVHNLESTFPALDFLKALEEITHLPVLLGICRRLEPNAAERQVLVRRLR